jgi:cell division protein ZipA
MDASTLRIILLVLGVLLLGALYLWERRRILEQEEHSNQHERRRRQAARHEPRFGEQPGEGSAVGTRRGAQAEPSSRRSRAYSGIVDAAPAHMDQLASGTDSGASPASKVAGRRAAQVQSEEATSASAAGPEAAAPAADAEPLLVQLFVIAAAQPFPGSAVQQAAERQHLAPGAMSIYHRQTREGPDAQARFSMANLVEPGTFPFDAMHAFETPGLALFAQFDGRPSDLMVYDELVQTAQALADELGGEVRLPPGRRLFDARAWERIRAELLALINERADRLTREADHSETAEAASASARDWAENSAQDVPEVKGSR